MASTESIKNRCSYIELTHELEKERLRADLWVNAVRELASELGLPAYDSKGSTQDWALIQSYARKYKSAIS